MLNPKVEKALNTQINAEIYSSYLYLSMSAWCEPIGLKGFANWMRVQAQEELVHAMKFYNYVCERGGAVKLTAIAAPPTEWQSALDLFESTYAHEQKVSGLINDLVNLAIEEKDHMTNNMLQWFVTEQIEEESSASTIAQELKLMGDTKGSLFMIDRELGTRVFVPPPGMGGAPAAKPAP
jgi:ferritin